MSVAQILAIFSGLFYKSAAVYFQSKTFFRYSFPLLSISSLVEIGIYKQIRVSGLANFNYNLQSEIFPAKFLAKNITLFRLSAIVIHDSLKDQLTIVSWTAEWNI